MNRPVDGPAESVLPLLNRWGAAAWPVFFIGMIVLVIVPLLTGKLEDFWQSYLFGWILAMNLALGCLAMNLLLSVVRGSWGAGVLRIFEAGSSPIVLILLALLFLPVMGGVFFHYHHLYHWAAPDALQDPVLREKAPYLNAPFFFVRYLIYFAIWILFSGLLRRSSLRQDRTGNLAETAFRVNLSAPGFVLFVLLLTFSYTDWVMSLDPHWFSTLWGLQYLVGQGLTAMALATVLAIGLRRYRPFSEVVTAQLTRDLGNLLLMGTMLWAYLALSQYLIIWSANLPEEITYYYSRNQGAGLTVGAFLIIAQFFAPFLMLIVGRTKTTPHYLVSVAWWILVVRFIEQYWVVTPFFTPPGVPSAFVGRVSDIAAFAAFVGLWAALFFSELKRHSVVPRHQASFVEELDHA